MSNLDIIIPSWNNEQFLNPCVQSIVNCGVLNGFARLIVVNNGKQPVKAQMGHLENVLVLEPGDNLGWEGGLAYALKHSDAPFVCFQNDDTFIPRTSHRLYANLLRPFEDPAVALVGPTTTTAAGVQSIYHPNVPGVLTDARWLIFFCVMVRRAHLDAVGGIDTGLPGGDDFDLSIRMRAAGKKAVIQPDAFLIHHGFQTGSRVYGDHNKPGGWNSRQMTDRTNTHLIRKHGFRTFFETLGQQVIGPSHNAPQDDKEGDLVRQFVEGDNVLELGCGATKTVPRATGVDRVAKGEPIPHLFARSVADIVADVSEPLPLPSGSQDTVISRHILEHCIDPVQTLRNWSEVLRVGGRLIIAVPDQRLGNTIPMNPEHVHAYTPETLANIAELVGLRLLSSHSSNNGVSFVATFEKQGISTHLLFPAEVAHA